MEENLRGLESREHNRSYEGHGLRMLWSKATFDSSGGYGLGDAQYIYTLKFTHQHALPLLSAKFTAHLETGVFSSGRDFFFPTPFCWATAFTDLGQQYEICKWIKQSLSPQAQKE